MPLTKNAKDAANRRVEIHVMDAQQAQLMKDRQEAKARKARSAGGGYLAPIKRQRPDAKRQKPASASTWRSRRRSPCWYAA